MNIAYIYPSPKGKTTEVVSFPEAIKRQRIKALAKGRGYESIEAVKRDVLACPTVSLTDLDEGFYHE